MSEPTKVVCPKCGATATSKSTISEGQAIRCPKCKEPFRYTTEAFRPASVEAASIGPIIDPPALEPWEAKINQRIEQLERANRRLAGLLCLMTMATIVTVGLFLATRQSIPRDKDGNYLFDGIIAKRIGGSEFVAGRITAGNVNVIDEKGTTFASIGKSAMTVNGSHVGMLTLHSENGASNATYASFGVTCSDSKMVPRATLYGGDIDEAGLVINDSQGRRRASLSLNDTSAYLEFRDANGHQRLNSGVDGGRAVLNHVYSDGRLRQLAE